MEEKTNEHLDKMNREQSIYNGNEPANPIKDSGFYRLGLTKREHLAGLAMQSLLTRISKRDDDNVDLGIFESKRIVEESVIMADMLLIELRKNKTE